MKYNRPSIGIKFELEAVMMGSECCQIRLADLVNRRGADARLNREGLIRT
jgi:hypothetical protein